MEWIGVILWTAAAGILAAAGLAALLRRTERARAAAEAAEKRTAEALDQLRALRQESLAHGEALDKCLEQMDLMLDAAGQEDPAALVSQGIRNLMDYDGQPEKRGG